ncbi:MAG TPA: glycoside hydrolase family 19 protein [Allosphingosinicella sp.]|jgi:putative chitinase|nr:glycoside hydrolase family 19 protein [Allosphingosinicella sp.]
MIDVNRLQTRLAAAGFYKGIVDGLIGKRTYAALFGSVARTDLGDKGLAIGEGCVAFLPAASIDTGLRLAHFLAQTATETGGFHALEENLSYSAKRMMAVFPARFPTLASTAGLVSNPRAFALKVYSNRLGNGAPATGDGFTYRGRGLIQLTGRANYEARAKETGLPLVDHPEIAADPKTSVQVASLYWTSRRINEPADADDVKEVRKRVNGGALGLDEAKDFLTRAKAMLI